MSSPASSSTETSANDSDGASPLPPAEAHALLRVCFERFQQKLVELTAAAIEETDDLFEAASHIPDGEVEAFRQQRAEWLTRFEATLKHLFGQRLAGHRRKGFRPDADATVGALRVLTSFDHEKQAALTQASRLLHRFTQRELAALDRRVGVLLKETSAREPRDRRRRGPRCRPEDACIRRS